MAKEEYIFTFGCGNVLGGKCVRIAGGCNMARKKMFETFGSEWAMQYSANEWESMKNDPQRYWEIEKEIPFEEAVQIYDAYNADKVNYTIKG